MLYSDNITKVCPEVMAAIQAVDQGDSEPHGADSVSGRLDESFSALFETEVRVFPVATGIAANALSLALVTPPYGTIYCHKRAHVQTTECGAPEHWTGGARLTLFAGEHNRIPVAEIAAALENWNPARPQALRPATLTLTQATEAGTIYCLEHISELAELAHEYGLAVHMDGARFANAVAALGCSPAEMTWKAGVDILSFGATKNGGMCADAVVAFKPKLAQEAGEIRVRAGQLFSKMRYASAQLEAIISGGLYLRNATHANRMAKRLSEGLERLPGVELIHPVEANEVFVHLPDRAISAFAEEGIEFYTRLVEGRHRNRFVCAWNTPEETIDGLVAAFGRHLADG